MKPRRFRSLLVIGLSLLSAAGPLSAAPDDDPQQGSPPLARPKIGLALGGGGARGMAHIGVIRMLEQLHIPIDYVAGTSMGAIIGGLYACGYTPDEMEALIKKIPWATLFDDAPERKDQSFRTKEDDFEHLIPLEFGIKNGGLVLPPGLIAGSKLGFVLSGATLPCSGVGSFDKLHIPFRAVATDIQTGEPFVMSSGNLARVMRASMAIPAIFTPVEIDGHLLVDGGLSQNLPVQTVQAMGADIVIAVNVGSSGAEVAPKPESVGAMIGRFIDLPLQQNTMASARLANIVITPDLTGYSSADFVRGARMIPLGEKATLADAAKLQQWAEPVADSAARLAAHGTMAPTLPVIDAIEIDPVPGMDPRRLAYRVRTKTGKVLDTVVLGHDLKRIFAMGNFSVVSYAIVEDGSRHILRITATLKSWGPTFLQLGLSLATDFQLNTAFGVTALVNATEMNSLGGQWKTTATFGSPLDLGTRFFQPLTYRGEVFLSPYAAWIQDLAYIFRDGDAVGTYQRTRGAVGMDLGYEFGTWGELRVGYTRAYGKGRRKVGDPGFPDVDWNEGGWTARMRVDQVDNVNLPHSGYFANIDYIANRQGLGGTESFDRFDARGLGVQTIGRWTGLARVSGGSGFGTQIPFYDEFQLGGLFQLSGRPVGQLTGNTYAMAALLLYYKISGGGAVIKNLSLGVSAEAGNTWEYRAPVTSAGMRTAGSIYLITDTIIGPFFFGYGRSGSGNSAAYMYLNRAF